MRDGEISTLGVGGKRLTADNQLGRQSDSKGMMESIKIFYRGHSLLSLSQRRISFPEYGAKVTWSLVITNCGDNTTLSWQLAIGGCYLTARAVIRTLNGKSDIS